MDYNDLKLLSIEQLNIFKEKCSDALFALQNSNDDAKIAYWSELQAMCLSLIRRKNNE